MSVLDDVELTLITTLDDVMNFKRWLGERRPTHALGLDTETTGLNPFKDRVRLIQIGDNRHGWALDRDRWLGILDAVINAWDGDWDLHNAPFDTLSLEKSCGVNVPRHRIHDTMVQSRINESNMSMALKSQAARHVDPAAAGLQEVLKGTQFTWETVPVGYGPYWQYGALDPVLTYCLDLYHRPIVEAEAPKAYELEMAVLWVVEDMRRTGACIDRHWVLDHYEKFTAYCAQVEQWVDVNYDVKPGSNAAIIEILERDGHTFSKATKSGAKSLDADVLGHIDHPLAEAVLGRRQAQKMASTYLKFYLNETSDAHPFVHPSFNTLGARTSRMSCDSPNLQNVPRLGTSKFADVVRNCIVSRYIPLGLLRKFDLNGFTQRDAVEHGALILCDFSQIEMRILAHLAHTMGDDNMRHAFMGDLDFFVALARQIYDDNTIDKKDPRRRVTKNGGYACVPLTTEIFTQRGWLSHDEVRVGDLTIGYNFEKRCSEWTPITQVVHYGNADLVSVGNHDRKFVTTPNHRWVCEGEKKPRVRRGETEETRRDFIQGFIMSESVPASGQRVLLAAPAIVGGELNATECEIEILGWALGDGGVYQGKFTDGPSQGRHGDRVAASIVISQCKPSMIRYIDDLLCGRPHKRYVSKRPTSSGYHCVTWKMQPKWSRSLFQRLQLWCPETGVRSARELLTDPWQFACKLSLKQREALIRGLHGSEGNESEFLVPNIRMNMSQAADSPVTDLMIALGYLTGRFVRVRRRQTDSTSSWTRKQCVSISYQQARITGQKAVVRSLGKADVWCVQTGLGTWTMRQDGDTPVLTGNTIYGAGIRKFALTCGVSENVAREFFRRWNALYPGVPLWQQSIINEAAFGQAETGQAFVRSVLTNRKFIGDAGKEYALGNYKIQGTAAEINKMKLIELSSAGLDEFMFATVHDEVLLDVPGSQILDVIGTLEKVMNDDDLLSVPIRAEIAYGHRWGKKQDWIDQ